VRIIPLQFDLASNRCAKKIAHLTRIHCQENPREKYLRVLCTLCG